MIPLDVIYTDAHGVPVPGHPGQPPAPDAGAEEWIAWFRAKQEYVDKILSMGSVAFAESFGRGLR